MNVEATAAPIVGRERELEVLDGLLDSARERGGALVVRGEPGDDQVAPVGVGGQASAALVDGAELKVYPGAPHGITDTHKDELNADLLAFVQGTGDAASSSPGRGAAVGAA